MAKKCCASCFGDRGLSKDIIPFRAEEGDRGVCSYCGAANEQLIAPAKLRQPFEQLSAIYIKNDEGKTLVEWFKEDWEIFPNMSIPQAKELLGDILDNGELVRQKFAPSALCQSDGLDRWQKLRDELMYANRFFPQTGVDEERLETLLEHLSPDSEEIPKTWYRARIQPSDIPYPISKMGSPPKEIASQGRANPSGIPYLYLASNPSTAVSEIRPHTGELASVADFSVLQELELVDLRNPKGTVSPFVLGDEDLIARLRGDIEFLIHLGNELTRPVRPQAAPIEYIPSQYLCEFIKKCGYNGVLYKSSVGDGVNLALFKPDLVKAGAVKQHRVTRVSVAIDE